MTRITPLFQSSLLTIERSDHPQNVVHVDGKERVPANYEVTFVESGQFTVRNSSELCEFESGDILLSAPGTPQTVSHPATGAQDICLSIRFQTETFENAIGATRKRTTSLKRKSNSATAFQMQRIRQAIITHNPLMIEELAVMTAHSFVPHSLREEWSSIDQNLAWYTRRVARVCDFLNDEYANSPSVTVLSHVAGISPFHFSRVFHYLMGLPIHQYVMRRQLVTAARSISNGISISDAAFDAGFSSLSYFSRSFRRHFGVAPRTFANRQRPFSRSRISNSDVRHEAFQ